MIYQAYVTFREYGYIEVEADSREEAIEKVAANLDQIEIQSTGEDDYEIEIEES